MVQLSDRKIRFAGLLENPYLSMLQRNILDYGRLQGLRPILCALKLHSVLDVGCGLGESSRACGSGYVGLDNSVPRVRYASRRFPQSRFILGDGLKLPVKPRSFDMVMLLDTAHHLTDEQFLSVLGEMAAASRCWVLISDAVLFKRQPGLSLLFYRFDRGAEYRDEARLIELLSLCCVLTLERVDHFKTFPGLYRRSAFLLRRRDSDVKGF